MAKQESNVEMKSLRAELAALRERVAQLETSETRWLGWLQTTTDSVAVVDREGQICEVLASQPTALVLNPQSWQGRTLAEILPEGPASALLNAVRRALSNRRPELVEYETLGAHNDLLQLSAFLIPVDVENERVLWVVRNVTGQACMVSKEDQGRLLADLQRQALLLQTAAEVSRAASSLLDLEALLSQVTELIRERFDMYYTGIFLLDASGQWAVLAAGTGEAGKAMRESHYQVALDSKALVAGAINLRTAQVALQFERGDTSVFENPFLPETRSKVALPLICRDRIIGAMTIQSARPWAFSEADVTVMQSMADQLANAIENVRLLQTTRAALARTEALYQAVHATTTASLAGLPEVLKTIADEAVQMLPADRVALISFDLARRQVLQFVKSGPGQDRLLERTGFDELYDGLSGWVLRERQGVLSPKGIPDERESPQVQQRRADTGGGSVMVVPLIYGERLLGTLTAINRLDQPDFTAQDLELLQMLANQAAVAVENVRLFEQTQARANELAVLNEMARNLTMTLDPADVAQRVYQYVSRLMDTTNFYLALYEVEAKEIVFLLDITEGKPTERKDGYRRRMTKGFTEHVIQSRQPLLISEDVAGAWERMGMSTAKRGAQSWLGVPVMVGERVIAVMTVQSYTTPGLYTEREQNLLSAAASQVAIAIENARLFRERDQRIEELSILSEIGRTLTPSLSLDEMVETVRGLISRLYNLDSFYIALYEEGSAVWTVPLRMERGVPQPRSEHQMGEGLTSFILRKRRPILLRTGEEMTNFMQRENIPLLGDPARSWMGTPLMSGKRVLGVMAIQDYERENLYGQHDLIVFSTIANQIAASLENARLFAQAQGERERLMVLYDVGRQLAGAATLDEVMRVILQSAGRIKAAYGEVLLFDFDGRPVLRSTVPERESISQEETLSFIRSIMSRGIERWVVDHRETVVVPDTHEDPRWLILPGHEENDPIRSLISAPLFDRQGKILGVLSYSHPQPGQFGPGDRQWVEELSGRMAMALESARLLLQTQERARREQLLSEVTARVRNSIDPESIIRIAAQELGVALGRPTFVQMGSAEQLSQRPAEEGRKDKV